MSQENPKSGLQLSERDELLLRIRELEERCRRAEDALRTSDERNQLLGDSAPFGIIVVETEGRVFGANRIMLNMLAWPSDRDVTAAECTATSSPGGFRSRRLVSALPGKKKAHRQRSSLSAEQRMDVNICAIISALYRTRMADFPALSPLSKMSPNSNLPRKPSLPAKKNIGCCSNPLPWP